MPGVHKWLFSATEVAITIRAFAAKNHNQSASNNDCISVLIKKLDHV